MPWHSVAQRGGGSKQRVVDHSLYCCDLGVLSLFVVCFAPTPGVGRSGRAVVWCSVASWVHTADDTLLNHSDGSTNDL